MEESECGKISEHYTYVTVTPIVFKRLIETTTSTFSCMTIRQFLLHHERGPARHLNKLIVFSRRCSGLVAKAKLSYRDV